MSLNEGREKEAFHIIFSLLRLDSAIITSYVDCLSPSDYLKKLHFD